MVYVECYTDALLAKTLGVPGGSIRHARGKGNVLKKLRQRDTGIGLLDEDPQANQPSELSKYRVTQEKGSLRLLEYPKAPGQRVVVICPRLEEWLYHRAALCKIDPGEYRLPRSAQDLKNIPRYDNQPNFQEFLRQLCQSDPEMEQLRQWMCC